GLGFSASTASSSSTSVTIAFDLPPGLGPFSVASSTPAANSVVFFVTPTQYVINLSAAADPLSVQGPDLLVNGQPATSAVLSTGNQTATLSVAVDRMPAKGLKSTAIAVAAFNKASNGTAAGAFNASFRYDANPLGVTSTNPPPGGTFTLPGPFTFDVNFNE